MDRQSLLDYIRPRMNEKRYIHTLGVCETAMELAKLYGEDVQKAEIAAILHDLAKFEDLEEMRRVIRTNNLGEDLANWGGEIMHGPVAAFRAKTELGIVDEDILNAMRYHTTGRETMSKLEQIIYVADMIEPNRKFDGVERLRELALTDLNEAMKACICHSVTFLVGTLQPIHLQSIRCYNFYVREEFTE